MKRVLLIILTIFFVCQSNIMSQTDKEFWFVAPEVTTDHYDNQPCGEYPGTCRGGEPTLMRISTNELPADVTIEQPANTSNFPPINLSIPANSTYTVRFTELGLQDAVENTFDNKDGVPGKSNKGLHVTSNSLITAYYEVRTKNNPDIWALKGENALGTEFYVPFQTKSTNQKTGWSTKAYHAIDIVATEDNTIIEITPTKPVYPGRAAGVAFTVTLNRGETFSVVPEWDPTDIDAGTPAGAFDRDAAAHMSGTYIRVTNGKKIAVSNKDDSVKHPGYGCYDLQGDQMVPVSVLGKEYIAMRGGLSDPIENLYIIGTVDNTNLWFNGNVGAPDAIVNRMGTYIYQINNGQDVTHVRADQKILVWHVSGWGCEQGGAILPPTDKCTGSGQVAFTRSTSEEFFINIMSRAGGEDGFEMNGVDQDGSAGTLFGPGDFIAVPGTADWTVAKIGPIDVGDIPVGVQTLIKNTKDIFHLGVINGSPSGGTRFGYFSDFNEVKVTSFTAQTRSPFYRGCAGESIQLIAKGATNYEWKPPTHLDDPYIATPVATPSESTVYTVVVSGACNMKDSTTVQVGLSYFIDADFTMSQTVACAPVTVDFSSSYEGIKEVRWDFGNGTDNWIFPDSTTFDSSFARTFQNETAVPIIYPIKMTIFNKEDCYDTITRYLVVNPRVTADFDISDTLGCAPMSIDFTNKSSGDTIAFEWDFGDLGSSNSTSPSHIYLNNSRADTTFSIRLIATSPNFCKDTAYSSITLHPYIKAGFTIDTIFACAEFNAIIKNTSFHVDSFYLDWGGNNNDTNMLAWTQLSKTYINNDTLPYDTIITLYAFNQEGCSDTVSRDIHISPEVTADFSMDITEGCDSSLVTFTNTSSGYKLNYKWDFGDGSSSISTSPTHIYTNYSNDSIIDTIQLFIESPMLCKDTHQLTFTVYPYINATFAIDTNFGCPPLEVTFNNNSSGVDSLIWDFGDGQTSNNLTNSFKHTYTNTSYSNDSVRNVTLITLNKFGCTDTTSRTVTTYKDIIAGFTPDKFFSCDTAEFFFSSTSLGADEFFWGFGDGATSTQNDSASHTYAPNTTAGNIPRTVSLFVLSSNKRCSDYWDTTVVLRPYNKAIFSFDTPIDCSPFYATINNGSTGATNTYKWYINGVQDLSAPSDGSNYNTTLSNASSNIKKFEIKLEAENAEGCISTWTDSIAAYPEITADFNINPDTNGCHPFEVNLTDASNNNTKYYWDFGDQGSAVIQNPTHIFRNLSNTDDTTYNVKLIAYTDNCKDSITKYVTVNPNPLAAFGTDVNYGCPPFYVSIINNSIAQSPTYEWDYGDGQTETNANDTIVHAYNNLGTQTSNFNLKLTTTTPNGCIDSATTIINSYPRVIADFSYDSAGCHRFRSYFTNNSVNSVKFSWNFGDGKGSSVKEPFNDFVNISNKDTNYTVTLISESEFGCSDTTSHVVTVFPTPDLAIMRDPTLVVFYNSPLPEITITNLTQHRNNWNYEWDFDDGSSGNYSDSVFTHTYNNWGPKSNFYRYDVITIAYNPNHPICNDTIDFSVEVRPPVPEASIVDIEPDYGCEPLTVTFNVLTEYEDSVYWDFDDGATSNSRTPVHTFTNSGYYNVRLTVYGDGGVNFDNTTISVYPSPIVDFIIDPTTVQLPDAMITASNQSLYGRYYEWDFGDGGSSYSEDPVHNYSSVGQYPITLIVTSSNGCRDSLTKDGLVTVIGEGILIFPTAFNPSESGSNGGYYTDAEINLPFTDIFRPYWKGISAEDYELFVFNRWGEQVFYTNNIYQGWDGYFNGKLCAQGVYAWKVKFTTVSGIAHEDAGNTTLIR